MSTNRDRLQSILDADDGDIPPLRPAAQDATKRNSRIPYQRPGAFGRFAFSLVPSFGSKVVKDTKRDLSDPKEQDRLNRKDLAERLAQQDYDKLFVPKVSRVAKTVADFTGLSNALRPDKWPEMLAYQKALSLIPETPVITHGEAPSASIGAAQITSGPAPRDLSSFGGSIRPEAPAPAAPQNTMTLQQIVNNELATTRTPFDINLQPKTGNALMDYVTQPEGAGVAVTGSSPAPLQQMIVPPMPAPVVRGSLGYDVTDEGVKPFDPRSVARGFMPEGGAAGDNVGINLRSELTPEERAAQTGHEAFYSRLQNAIAAFPQNKATGAQWRAALEKGGWQAEREWTGVEKFLTDNANKPVTRAQIADLAQQNAIKIKETVYGKRYVNEDAMKKAPPALRRELERVAREAGSNDDLRGVIDNDGRLYDALQGRTKETGIDPDSDDWGEDVVNKYFKPQSLMHANRELTRARGLFADVLRQELDNAGTTWEETRKATDSSKAVHILKSPGVTYPFRVIEGTSMSDVPTYFVEGGYVNSPKSFRTLEEAKANAIEQARNDYPQQKASAHQEYVSYAAGNGVVHPSLKFATKTGTGPSLDTFAADFKKALDAKRAEDAKLPKPAKYESYAEPGGSNYREVLLQLDNGPTLPKGWKVEKRGDRYAVINDTGAQVHLRDTEDEALRDARSMTKNAGISFQSGHFDEPNILAHIRLKDRKLPSGERALSVEEIQSDWNIAGRERGFQQQATQDEIDAAKSRLAKAQNEKEQAEEAFGVARNDLNIAESDMRSNSTRPLREGDDKNEAYGNGTIYDNELFRQLAGNDPKYIEQMKAFDKARERRDAARLAFAEADNAWGAISSSDGVPNHPFKRQEDWVGLAMKRIIDEAVKGGYDRVAWTTGAQQAARYDLSKQVSSLVYYPESQRLIAYGPDDYYDEEYNGSNEAIFDDHVEPDKLAEHIGAANAKKLLGARTDWGPGGTYHKLDGMNFEMGGEQHKSLYDQVMPNWVKQYAKKNKVKIDVENTPGAYETPEERGYREMTGRSAPGSGNPGFKITPELRALVNKGGQALGAATAITVANKKNEKRKPRN
jgi:hypothetical protein